jgi:hypothetical protein
MAPESFGSKTLFLAYTAVEAEPDISSANAVIVVAKNGASGNDATMAWTAVIESPRKICHALELSAAIYSRSRIPWSSNCLPWTISAGIIASISGVG